MHNLWKKMSTWCCCRSIRTNGPCSQTGKRCLYRTCPILTKNDRDRISVEASLCRTITTAELAHKATAKSKQVFRKGGKV